MRKLCLSAPLGAVNDNGREAVSTRTANRALASYARPQLPMRAANDQHFLAEALRHFARHGLSAAAHARANAEAARATRDEEACQWWISICRQLDRRMADAFTRRIAKLG